MSVPTISPKQLEERRRAGEPVELIDVRMGSEFQEIHVEYAKNIPLDRLNPALVMAGRTGAAGSPLYVVCRSGKRAEQACQKFLAAGFENVVNVEGGTLACKEAGLPVVEGKKAISLQRQVQITAGLMVLTGIVLSLYVHPYWLGLTAFVGCGLVFSGITDTCAMGWLLAKMPWNQAPATNAPAATCCSSKTEHCG